MCTLHKQFYKLIRPSMIWINYVRFLIATRFKQVLIFFLYDHYSFSTRDNMPEITGELSINLYKCKPGTREEEVECAVCLCKIEEGEEIKQLRCDHLFHRVCLDRWLGYRRVTCPLCRCSLFPCRKLTEFGVDLEVLLFKYSSLSSVDRERWWLR